MEQRRILVVDDEEDLGEILRYNLETEGYAVSVAHSAEEALAAGPQRFDLLLLDVMMPGMSGFELAGRLGGCVPIIFLTALDAEDDLLRGFGLGADDYIAKPFSVRELSARVKAVLSRSQSPILREESRLHFRGLTVDLQRKVVSVDGEAVTLTKTEFGLLRLLIASRPRVFSRQDILAAVWPSDVVVTERTVDVNIARLRRKLGPYAACIVNRSGFGYCFSDEESE